MALPPQHTGSSLFHAVLAETVEQFPEALRAAGLPPSGAWKKSYGQVLARFEACRVSSPQRAEIARFILSRSQAALVHVRDGVSRPLSEHLSEQVAAPALQSETRSAEPSFRVEVPFEGELHSGRAALHLVDRLLAQNELTKAAAQALRWTIEHIEAQGGVLDLRNQRFALLGAGAELAPTAALLSAGAHVLWVDVSSPDPYLAARKVESGTLSRAADKLDLLENPAAIRATIERFAADGGGPVHLGAFAYASGASKEWRLGAAMNAIASHLAPSTLASLSMWVSPTTVPELQPESVRAAEEHMQRESMWKSTLRHAGLLTRPGSFVANGANIGLATVSIQGLSYQAAQYVSKLCAAETYALYGTEQNGHGGGQSSNGTPRRGLTVSANIAGITRTRSLSHPLFEAAFLGAPRFSVRIFAPETTRALSTLLMLHDILNPLASGHASSKLEGNVKAAALHAQQVHGGIYNLPYSLESAIRIAALLGMGRNPAILLKRSKRSGQEARV
ncbi:MAG: hypothetical protein ABW321_20760 [Polyangiales bacterium]